MHKVFRLFHPQQIARYVKAFHQGHFDIAEQGRFHFQNGIVNHEQHHGHHKRRSVAMINQKVREMRLG